jgi:activator of 2-hydroxyglutaryl-CoA dehydratase
MAPLSAPAVIEGESLICGLDVGSTTCKYTLATPRGEVLAQAYERHNTRQAEKILQFLTMLESKHGLTPGRDRVFFTGSGAGIIAPLVGGKVVQEVVAVAAAVDKLHPNVRFVSEIGGEDMKTIFFQGEGWFRRARRRYRPHSQIGARHSDLVRQESAAVRSGAGSPLPHGHWHRP